MAVSLRRLEQGGTHPTGSAGDHGPERAKSPPGNHTFHEEVRAPFTALPPTDVRTMGRQPPDQPDELGLGLPLAEVLAAIDSACTNACTARGRSGDAAEAAAAFESSRADQQESASVS
jgi:hypothetical protein